MSRDKNCLHRLPTVNTPSTRVLHTQHTLACINKRVQYPKIHPLRTPTLELLTVMHTQRCSHLQLSPRLARGTSSSDSRQLQTTTHRLRTAAVKSLMMLAWRVCAAASSARSVNDSLELAIWRHTTAKLPHKIFMSELVRTT